VHTLDKLLLWREGQTYAERLSADILILDGFESVDPQLPLGGPDGLKDVICEKNNWSYIGAAYFAHNQATFATVKRKFRHDLEGVQQNKVDGIVFLTNQYITPKQTKILQENAEKISKKAIFYDVERIRALLDSPFGFPLRLQYLGIEMNKEEQLSFFAKQKNELVQLFDFYSNNIVQKLGKRIDACCDANGTDKELLYEATQSSMAFVSRPEAKTDKKRIKFPTIRTTTENLTTESLCNIHKQLLFDSKSAQLGQYREVRVWIGTRESKPESSVYVAPKADEVSGLMEKLLEDWRKDYMNLKLSKDRKSIIQRIAQFHNDFLEIHPFLDGNGRMARFLLNQQISELLGVDEKIVVEDKPAYFYALSEGQKDNLSPLIKIITQSIYGQDEL